jgi:glyoxylase I family protein
MLNVSGIHHVAIICANYERSKHFYTKVMGFQIVAEHYRKERKSWKLDLAIGDRYAVELFSFPDTPARVSRPEACGLRHLAFAVEDIELAIQSLKNNGILTEPVRTDEYTGKKFTFFTDPDNLPLELYQTNDD